MKSMASCVLARMSLSWSTLKHPLCGHPGILWPCWSLLIGTVSNFAWGAMLRPANSLFPACCCARPIPRWYFAAICTCSQVGIANIFQLKQLKHCSEVGLLHEASEVILLLSKTALYTWWAHHRVISSHIEPIMCVFSMFFARWLRMPWNAGNSMVMALHAHALLATLQPPGQRRAKWEQVCPYRRREPK